MKILGKVALITGGAQGLGKEFADQLLRRSAQGVCLVDINQAVGKKTEAEFISKYGQGKAKFCFADVTKKDQFKASFDLAKSHFGRLDIVCNNAGITDEDNQERITAINFTSVVNGTKLAIDAMSTQNGGEGGTVVNVASMAGLVIMTSQPMYTATKHAVVGFTRSVGNDYDFDQHGVRINCICPGFTETEMTKGIHLLTESDRPGDKIIGGVELMQPDVVGRGFIQLIEDDTKNGDVMRVTKEKGIDFQYYKPGSKL